MRFGESFPQGADPKNRMDTLNENKSEELPSYIKFGLEIRNKLREQIKKEGWPAMPEAEEIKGVEDIFEIAKNKVNDNWQSSAQGLIQNKADEWVKGIDKDDQDLVGTLNILKNPEELATSLRLNQLGALENLRSSNPDAWRSLNIASAERQMASISVLEHWLRDENAQANLEKITAKIGLNKEELKLFVDLAGILGKYVDQAFIKQMELADMPGGSEKTKLGNKQGAENIYDLYKEPGSQEINLKTYKEMFPFEWAKIEKRLQNLAARTKTEVEEALLPEEYKGFGEYLDKMAVIYGSDNINVKKLDKEWKNFYKEGAELNKSNCPIMLLPHGATSVTGEANKIDVEMRLGLKTKETRQQESELEVFRKIAQEFISENKKNLKNEAKIPEVVCNYQPWAFGSNLSCVTVGDSDESQIMVHVGADKEIIKQRELPVLQKILPNENINFEAYLKAVVNENTLHEIGHTVLNSDDPKIHDRIGTRFEAGALEELKAETVGIKILLAAKEQGVLPEKVNLREQLLAKFGTSLNYLKNNPANKNEDGEEYFICGATIIGHLFAKGLIKKNSGVYELGETENCLQEIAAISEQVLSFYTDSEAKPSGVKVYINELRKKESNSEFQEFLKKLLNE